MADARRLEDMKAFFARNLAGSSFVNELSTYCTFTAPTSSAADLSQFFELLEAQRDALGILDVQISQGTLEEVFIRVARMSEGRGFLSKQRLEEDPAEAEVDASSFSERTDKKGKQNQKN